MLVLNIVTRSHTKVLLDMATCKGRSFSELTLDMDKDINSETILSAYTFLAQEHLALRGQQNLIQRAICLTFGCQHVVQIGCS